MSEPLYASRARIAKVEGVHRRARLETGTTVEMGVHGPIKRLFGLEDAVDLPLPVDYIVAATGG
ncbi:MAG: hypothetical protein R3E98_11960 [Gemmatimonadota bacterium]|nr:hypothetical protein [Gemmatimonadota bacterium]